MDFCSMSDPEDFSNSPKGSYITCSPTHLCLYNGQYRENTLRFFTAVESYPKTEHHFIRLDFSDLEYISAAAVTYLFAMVTAMQIYISNNYYSFKLPKNKKTKELFIGSGLHVALKKGGIRKVKSLWKESPFLCGNNKDASKFVNVLKKRSNVSPLPQNLSSAIRETFLNINHHAYFGPSNLVDITWWCYFSTDSDSNGNFISAVIVDRGMGIPESIKRAFMSYNQARDSKCLEYAMQETVTSTKEKGRGKGSENIKKPISLNRLTTHDKLLVMSGEGCYRYCQTNLSQNVDVNELKNRLRGTLVEWKLYY
jgi:hypothetical protein